MDRKRARQLRLILCISDIHLFPNTPEGHALLHQLQQRAEAWSEGVSSCRMRTGIGINETNPQGILTMIFSTDDFCVYVIVSVADEKGAWI